MRIQALPLVNSVYVTAYLQIENHCNYQRTECEPYSVGGSWGRKGPKGIGEKSLARVNPYGRWVSWSLQEARHVQLLGRVGGRGRWCRSLWKIGGSVAIASGVGHGLRLEKSKNKQ